MKFKIIIGLILTAGLTVSCGNNMDSASSEITDASGCVLRNSITVCESSVALISKWETNAWTNYSKARSEFPGAQIVSKWFSETIEEPEGGGILNITTYFPKPYPGVDNSLPDYRNKCVFESPIIVHSGPKNSLANINLNMTSDLVRFNLVITSSSYNIKKSFNFSGEENHSLSFNMPANTKDFQVKICDVNFKEKTHGTSKIKVNSTTLTQIYQ